MFKEFVALVIQMVNVIKIICILLKIAIIEGITRESYLKIGLFWSTRDSMCRKAYPFDLPAKSLISRFFLSLQTWNDHLFLNERIYLISVLLEILDQYLLGGIDASKEDLDHVFLRFGK